MGGELLKLQRARACRVLSSGEQAAVSFWQKPAVGFGPSLVFCDTAGFELQRHARACAVASGGIRSFGLESTVATSGVVLGGRGLEPSLCLSESAAPSIRLPAQLVAFLRSFRAENASPLLLSNLALQLSAPAWPRVVKTW